MAYPFLAVNGYGVGMAKVDENVVTKVLMINKLARERGVKLYLPVDFVIAEKFDGRAETKLVTFQEVPDGWFALDIGPCKHKAVFRSHGKCKDNHLERPYGGI